MSALEDSIPSLYKLGLELSLRERGIPIIPKAEVLLDPQSNPLSLHIQARYHILNHDAECL